MWKVTNALGQEKVWYEKSLIDRIKQIVQEQTQTRMLFADKQSYKAFCDIEKLIQEFER